MKILPRFKRSKKKRQEQLQKKERTEDRDITEHSSQESLQCSEEDVDMTNSCQESKLELGLENVDVTNATNDFDKKVKELIECCAFLECLQSSDENVGVANTTDDFYTNFKELIEGYENDEGEYIDMSQPRDASYATETEKNFDTRRHEIVDSKRLGKDICLTSAATNYRSMDTEFRGITLRQLRAIIPLMKRRCGKEKWTRPVYKDGKETKEKDKVTLENATLYDINKYIIKPFTKSSQKSFVETLPSTKGTQPPRWFVSHYWGESFVHTMACLEQMVKDFERNLNEKEDRKGGGMTEDTPIWICAFANNQHNIESDIADDPADTSFAKAMKIAKFRVISILDVKSQVYTRLWCMYELYLTLLLSKEQGILAIYTYHEHIHGGKRKAVGLVEGGATTDGTSYDDRQKHFPRGRLLPLLKVSIQDAVASRDEDRIHILNSLVGRRGDDLELEPLHSMHDNYGEFNEAIRGAVFSSQATLKIVYETDETEEKEYWNSALSALKKSTVKEFQFHPCYMPQVTKEAMAQLFHHLPSGLEQLFITNCPHGRVAMDALLDWLENNSTNLKDLSMSGTFIGGEVGGKECGERLAKFLAQNDCKIKYITLSRSNLIGPRNFNTWIECLEKNQSLWSLHKEKLKEEASKFESLLSSKGSVHWRRALKQKKKRQIL